MGTDSTGLKKFPELYVLSVGIGKPALCLLNILTLNVKIV